MGEILACQSMPMLNGLAVALLDCHDVVRLDRLWQRGSQGATQEMLSWAAWLRVHAVEPKWRRDVIRDNGLPNMNWERWEHLKRGDPTWVVHVIDTTKLTVDQVVEALSAWIVANSPQEARGH